MTRSGVVSKNTAVFSILAAALLISRLAARQTDGEILIAVKDPSGAAVMASGALVSLTGGISQNFQTDPSGLYTFHNLSLGRYRLEVNKSGFATASLEIDVSSAAPVSRTITLSIRTEVSKVTVVAPTPLAGTDVSVDQMGSAAQTATAVDIQNSGAIQLGDFMNRHLSGVYLNEMQANPFQPDVNFRGYTASPLLGTPEGISVYLDGVRQNQPFGDVVSWDLIQFEPNSATISSTDHT